MKKLLLTLFVLTFVVSASFAQGQSTKESSGPVKVVEKGVQNVSEFVGKVVSVTVAEPAQGIKDSTVQITDDMGNPVSYTVRSGATIVDASLNAITLGIRSSTSPSSPGGRGSSRGSPTCVSRPPKTFFCISGRLTRRS